MSPGYLGGSPIAVCEAEIEGLGLGSSPEQVPKGHLGLGQ